MAQGTVKFFNEQKGYGFITIDGGNDEAFVHYSSIEGEGFGTLRTGERVEFVVRTTAKGLSAESVRSLDDDAGGAADNE